MTLMEALFGRVDKQPCPVRTRNCLPAQQSFKFILVINQLDAQNFFTVSLFHASTCFEDHVLIVRRTKLYYTASGIITPIDGCPVHGSATYTCDDTCDDTRCCIIVLSS